MSDAQTELAEDQYPDDPLRRQVGGDHYRSMAIQPAEFLRANGTPHIEGEAIYHILRHKQKAGAEDIRKAIHWLELILKLDYSPSHPQTPDSSPACQKEPTTELPIIG